MDGAKSWRRHRACSAAALPVGSESCCVARFCSVFDASVTERSKRPLQLSVAERHMKLHFIFQFNNAHMHPTSLYAIFKKMLPQISFTAQTYSFSDNFMSVPSMP